MQKDNTVLGLDFGSHTITAVMCELTGPIPIIKGMGTCETSGMEKGVVVDKDAYRESIERAIKRAEQIAGIRPKRMVTNVPYNGIQFVKNIGLLLSPDDHHLYTEMDKKEAIRRSKNIVKPASKKIMHVIPTEYTISGTVVSDPIGQKGNPLEVSTHLILSDGAQLNDIVRHSRELSLTIEGIVFDGLASSQVYLSDEERHKGAVFIDIGGQFTKAHVMQNDSCMKSAYIKLGGHTITQDIATCLKVSIPEAERLKILHGELPSDAIDPEEKLDITTIEGRSVIKRTHLAQIIEARLQEMIQLLLKSLGNTLLDPDFAMVFGGASSQIKGFETWFAQHADRPFRVGFSPAVQCDDVEAGAALGLVYYGIKTNAIQMTKPVKPGMWKKLGMAFSR